MFNKLKKSLLDKESALIWVERTVQDPSFSTESLFTVSVDEGTSITFTSTTLGLSYVLDASFFDVFFPDLFEYGTPRMHNVGITTLPDYLCIYLARKDTGTHKVFSICTSFDFNSGEQVSQFSPAHSETETAFGITGSTLYATLGDTTSNDAEYPNVALFPLSYKEEVDSPDSITYATYFQTEHVLYSREETPITNDIVTIGGSSYLRQVCEDTFGSPYLFGGDYFSIWYRIS